jgi:hypothetical protein
VLGSGLLETGSLVSGEAQRADTVGALGAGEAADCGLHALHSRLAGGDGCAVYGAQDGSLDGVKRVQVGAALGPGPLVLRPLALGRLRHPRGGDPRRPALSRTRGTTGSARDRPSERPPHTCQQRRGLRQRRWLGVSGVRQVLVVRQRRCSKYGSAGGAKTSARRGHRVVHRCGNMRAGWPMPG